MDMDQDTVADVRIVACGDFGTSVATHLRSLLALPGGRERMVSRSDGRIGVRASWRDVPAEFEAFGAGHPGPWLPVALAHPYIRVGPLFVPGHAPCHTCFLTRVRQHENAVDAEISQRLAEDSSLGVRGFLPHQSMIAAGLALALMRGEERGLVTVIDCRTDEMTSWHVVPAEQCPGCDDGRER
jgi:hypothetical protein